MYAFFNYTYNKIFVPLHHHNLMESNNGFFLSRLPSVSEESRDNTGRHTS